MPLRDLMPYLIDHSRALGRIEQQLKTGEVFHCEVREHMTDIRHRVTKLEKPRPTSTGIIAALGELSKSGKALATAITSLREWAVGATVVASSLYAQINPEGVRAWFDRLVSWVSGGGS